MKSLRKSVKALSPVVASIILIAVTVAVSIAVAAWMGMLSVGFMGSSSMTITDVTFVSGGASITVDAKNTGTKTVTISSVKVNNVAVTWSPSNSTSVDPGNAVTLTLTQSWIAGNPYKIDLYDSSGQIVGSTQQTAT